MSRTTKMAAWRWVECTHQATNMKTLHLHVAWWHRVWGLIRGCRNASNQLHYTRQSKNASDKHKSLQMSPPDWIPSRPWLGYHPLGNSEAPDVTLWHLMCLMLLLKWLDLSNSLLHLWTQYELAWTRLIRRNLHSRGTYPSQLMA